MRRPVLGRLIGDNLFNESVTYNKRLLDAAQTAGLPVNSPP